MNEILTASTGVIMSQSPGSGFPHFESCSWVVKVEPGYNITFTIEHFQTSRQFDELEIFDGEFAATQGTSDELGFSWLSRKLLTLRKLKSVFVDDEEKN